MKKPQIATMYLGGMEPSYFDDLVSEISQPNLDRKTRRSTLRFMATMEWLISTAAIESIVNSIF